MAKHMVQYLHLLDPDFPFFTPRGNRIWLQDLANFSAVNRPMFILKQIQEL